MFFPPVYYSRHDMTLTIFNTVLASKGIAITEPYQF